MNYIYPKLLIQLIHIFIFILMHTFVLFICLT